MKSDNQLGRNIQAARQAAGLTQRQLSIILDCNQNTISRWEVGATKPDLDTLARLAAELRTTASDLLR